MTPPCRTPVLILNQLPTLPSMSQYKNVEQCKNVHTQEFSKAALYSATLAVLQVWFTYINLRITAATSCGIATNQQHAIPQQFENPWLLMLGTCCVYNPKNCMDQARPCGADIMHLYAKMHHSDTTKHTNRATLMPAPCTNASSLH